MGLKGYVPYGWRSVMEFANKVFLRYGLSSLHGASITFENVSAAIVEFRVIDGHEIRNICVDFRNFRNFRLIEKI